MRPMLWLFLAAALTALSACDSTGSLQGGGNGENAGYGHVKIGVPF